MSNINKQAYHPDGGEIGIGRLKEIADNVYGDEEKCWLAKRVLALLDELEAAEKTSEARREALDRTHKMYQREKVRAEAAEKRVAELDASHVKLRESMAAIHNTIRLDGVGTSLSAIMGAAKRAHEESASVAGIRINGEG